MAGVRLLIANYATENSLTGERLIKKNKPMGMAEGEEGEPGTREADCGRGAILG